MKRLLICAVMTGAMVGQLAAQGFQRGVVVLSPGGVVVVPGSSNPAWWDDPTCGRPPGRDGPAYACDPYYAGNSARSVMIAMPWFVAPPAPAPPPPPQPTVRSEVREYHWPSSGSDSSAATFSIFSKDGQPQSAVMVWVEDDALCYVTSGGSQGRMPIDSIDRQATHQRNAEKRLNFWLPDESSTAHLQALVSPVSGEP